MTNVDGIERAEKQSYFQSRVLSGSGLRCAVAKVVVQALCFLQGSLEVFIHEYYIEPVAEAHFELGFE